MEPQKSMKPESETNRKEPNKPNLNQNNVFNREEIPTADSLEDRIHNVDNDCQLKKTNIEINKHITMNKKI